MLTKTLNLIQALKKYVRETIDRFCFNYVIGLIDEVLDEDDLAVERGTSYLGQIDQQIARAIKAEVLLTRASPLFNGNSEFYSNFKGKKGELLFPIKDDPEKWKDALDAIKEAIDFAESNGKNCIS